MTAKPPGRFRARHPSTRRVHTPTVLQMEAAECGAAALGIVLAYYGRYESLETLRSACGVSRDGSNARNVVLAARRYGLDAAGFRRSADEVLQAKFPLIVFWGNNHFLVVEGCSRGRVYVNDPALGPRSMVRADFDALYSGITLEFVPNATFRRSGRPVNTARLLVTRLKGSAPALVMIAIAAIVLGVLSIVLPALTSIFVDQILVRHLENWVEPLLLVMAIGILMQAVATWMQHMALVRLSTWLGFTQAARFVWHMLRLPVGFFAQREIGDFAQRLQANDRIADLVGSEAGTAALSLIVSVMIAAAMLLYEVELAFVAIIASFASVVVLRAMARRRADNSQRRRTDQARMYGSSIVGLQTIETLKAAGAEDAFFGQWSGYQARLINTEQTLAWINALTTVTPQFLFGLSNAVIIGFGGWKVMQGDLTLGGLVAFQMLTASFGTSVQQFVDVGGTFQSAQGDLSRLQDVLDTPLDWRHAEAGQEIDRPIEGELSLRKVSFGYDRLSPPLIADLDIEVAAGGSLALVGGSGSGKSTIGRLITGLVTPWSGDIEVDRTPLRQWAPDRLAASLSVVEQDVVIFEGTVRENITLWDPGVPQQAIIDALRDVDLLDTVLALPETLDARIEEGGRNLSGGQRQRLDIARAIVRGPRLLLLDEATSALDAIAEKTVIDALKRRHCTTVMVAHRLSTIRDCDEIIVLDHGNVVERGTHETLLAADGEYARLLRQE